MKDKNIVNFIDTLNECQINIILEEEKILREKYGIKKMLDKTFEKLNEKIQKKT